MNRNFLLTVVALLVLTGLGCQAQVPTHGHTSPHRGPWALDRFSSIPADEVTVDSGVTFHWKEIPCQLLGVRESADASKRQQAVEFSKRWFQNIHYKHLSFYNGSSPLTTEDGACVVWLYGDIYPHGTSTLNTEVVRAGLVELDKARWADYSLHCAVDEGRGQRVSLAS